MSVRHILRYFLPEAAAERRWALQFASLAALVTSIPYLLAWSMQGKAWQFSGFLFGVEDGNSYIAKMLSGTAGAWLFRTPYTASPQQGVLAFFPYLLLGKLAAQPAAHEQLVGLFHLLRIASIFAYVFASYAFISLFIHSSTLRRWAVALISFGGGLGWVLVVSGHTSWLGSLPLDLYSPESFGFLELYGLPHLAFARALLLFGLTFYLDAEKSSLESKPVRRSLFRPEAGGIRAGIAWLLLGFFQPVTVVIAWFILFVHLFALGLAFRLGIERKKNSLLTPWLGYIRRAFWAVLLSAPVVAYTALSFWLDPFLSAWSEQNRIISPHPAHYLLAYGWLVPLIWFGARRLLRVDLQMGSLVLAWALSLPILAYAPLNLQRRLPEGIWVAFVVLALAGLEEWFLSHAPQDRRLRRLASGLLFLSFPSSLILLSSGILAALHPGPPAFRPAGEVDAFRFLSTYAHPGDVTLASYETGNPLPAWAPVRVLIGLGPESTDLSSLQPLVDDFYTAGVKVGSRQDFLRSKNVRFVFWGPLERVPGGWSPENLPYLRPIYASGEYQIYEVLDGSASALQP